MLLLPGIAYGHLTDSYLFGATPYGLVFARDILSNTIVFGATTYGFIFGMLQVSGDGIDNFHALYS